MLSQCFKIRKNINFFERLFFRQIADFFLCTLYFHFLFFQLAEKSAVNEESFPWQSRLRYYWSDDEVMLRMMHSELIYGYEYLTAYTKLVMTPLTERCYR